jgi:DNA polymerase-3 subunit alpha
LNSRQLDILVKLDFFSEFGKAQKLLKIIDLYNMLHGKKQIKKEKTSLPTEVLEKYCISETEKMYKFNDKYMDAMLASLCHSIPDTDIPLQTKLQTQQEMLGYISYCDPSKPNSAVVMSVDCKYSPKANLYLIGSSKTTTAKITKKLYQNNPFNVGDVLNFRSEQRPKWKKVDGEWVQDASSGYDTWLTYYTIEQ